MVRAVDSPRKDCYALIKFTYGNPNSPSYKAYTNWTEDLPGNPIFTSIPTMELTVPDNTGTLESKVLQISLPITDSWFAEIISGVAIAPVFVDAMEITKPVTGGESSSLRYFFKGRLIRTVKNLNGKPNYGLAEFANIKTRLQIPMGLPANHHCVWTLFGRGCAKSSSGFYNGLTVNTIVGKTLTTTTNPPRTGTFFHRGYIVKDGIRIGIRWWDDSAPDTFYLIKPPPLSWIGKGILAYAGCDKTIETCRARFGNEPNFG
jgi:hypothetical protein